MFSCLIARLASLAMYANVLLTNLMLYQSYQIVSS